MASKLSRDSSVLFSPLPPGTPETEPINRPYGHASPRPFPMTPRRVLDGVPFLSPGQKPPESPEHPVPGQIDLETEEEQPVQDFHETTEKTNHWASLCFGAAFVFMGLSAFDGYRTYRDRSFSLLIAAGFWSLVATVIGTAGEILQKTTKVETSITSSLVFSSPEVAPYQEGQPIAIKNDAPNMCFVNAPTQAIMNDAEYPRVFKKICESAKRRHKAFKEFLELFPPPDSILPFWLALPNLFKSKEKAAPKPLPIKNMRDVLAALMPRKSGLKYDSAGFQDKYPQIHQVLGLFLKARKEADFPDIPDGDLALNSEFGKMKEDQDILKFFYEQRDRINEELKGFDAFLTLINAYDAAVEKKERVLSLQGRFSSSPIGNVRNLMPSGGGVGQEAVDEFLHCLSKYVLPDDYPGVFFPVVHQQLWAECPEQDEAKLREYAAKHNNAVTDDKKGNPGDILTALPADKKTCSDAVPCCILKIEDPLTKDADGQKLIHQTLSERQLSNNAQPSGTVFIDTVEGRLKMYYPIQEQFIIKGVPERIIIQLKRFEYSAAGGGAKINFPVTMPEVVEIQKTHYQLKSVVVHDGTLDGGHYYALVKKEHVKGDQKESKWWHASDETVTGALPIHEETAFTKGFLYFYERR